MEKSAMKFYTHSRCGREWAKISELKAGDWIEADRGFSCGINSMKLQVGLSGNGLYVGCQRGHHYLDGQLAEDNEHLIGFWPAV